MQNFCQIAEIFRGKCEIRFEERTLVEKINKLGNTLQSPGGELKF